MGVSGIHQCVLCALRLQSLIEEKKFNMGQRSSLIQFHSHSLCGATGTGVMQHMIVRKRAP